MSATPAPTEQERWEPCAEFGGHPAGAHAEYVRAAASKSGVLDEDERTAVDDALAAWEARGPTSLTVALVVDALYGLRERDEAAVSRPRD